MNKMFIPLLAATLILAPACGNSKKDVEKEVPAQPATEVKMTNLAEKVKADAIYKAVPATSFDKNNAADCVKLSPKDAEGGFINATKGDRAEKTLKKSFKGEKEIVLLQLDEKVLNENGITVKMEKNKPLGKHDHPHLYGKKQIPAAAVVEVIVVEEQADGSWMAK